MTTEEVQTGERDLQHMTNRALVFRKKGLLQIIQKNKAQSTQE